MRVDIVTVAYNCGSDVERLIDSAESDRHRVGVHLFLHSAHGPTASACARLAARPQVRYRPIGWNQGLSRSWNEGLLDAFGRGADLVIVANDDIVFGPGDLDRLAGTAAEHPESFIVTCAGPHVGYRYRLPSHGYACFAVNPIALERIGCFDENFFPAYCEDQDYSRRAALAGLPESNCPDTEVTHRGSASIGRDPFLAAANAQTHGRNLEYYRRKWGGDAGKERFTSPFDDPALGPMIPAAARHTPYGHHDRPDLPGAPG
jgi:GT2 family glycosyltransferase